MAIINLSHRGDTFDKLSDISLVFKKMECIGRYIKNEGQLSVDLKRRN